MEPMEEDKPAEEDKPYEEDKPAEKNQPMEEDKSAEKNQPMEEDKPAEEKKHMEEDKPAEENKPMEEDKPLEENKPEIEDKPLEENKPEIEDKPLEENKPAIEDKSPAKDNSSAEDKSMAEDKSLVEDKPNGENKPEVEDKLMVKDKPAVEDKPSAEDKRVLEERAAVDDKTAVVDKAGAADKAVVEDKAGVKDNGVVEDKAEPEDNGVVQDELAVEDKPEENKPSEKNPAEEEKLHIDHVKAIENVALDIEDDMDSDSSQNSTPDVNNSSKKRTVTDKIKRRRKKGGSLGGKSHSSANSMNRAKLHYKCSNFIKEDHKQPIFGVQFYQYIQDPDEDPLMFGTVGANRASIYRCGEGCGRINLYQSYADADPEESFYSCAWTYNPETGDPLFCFAGAKGVIHILNPVSRQFVRTFQGYGSSVNELKAHPIDPVLLLGTSKDHTIRLWNIKTEACVAIFSGVEGHRDEVLSADFDILGTRIVSCGMDHSLKFWSLDTPKIKQAIKDSHEYSKDKMRTTFPSLPVNYPEFTTRDVHRNYVDCCVWLGDLVLSKSCDNQVVCWHPKEPLDVVMNRKNNDEVGVFVLHKFEINQCDIWFMRFAVDYNQNLLAMGNQVGKIFLYSLEGDHPSMLKPQVLVNNRCNSAIRQMSFNVNAKVLMAVCDDGTIWRWDKQ